MGTPDKAKAATQWQRWYAEHREEVITRKRASYAANRDARLAEQRADYHSRLDEKRSYYRAYSKIWRAKQTPGKRFAMTANQRASRYDGELLDWQNLPLGPCVYCGRDNETVTWDHAIPLSRGGANRAWNCVRSCLSCNRHKQAKTPQQWLDPATAEARRERKRAYIRQWHRDHYAELYARRKAGREEKGHW